MNQYDHLKDTLQQYRIPVDKEKLWKQTSHAIRQRKRRRTLLFFFIGMLGAASVWLTLRHPADTHQTTSAANILSDTAIQHTNASPQILPTRRLDQHGIPTDKTERPQNSNPNVGQIKVYPQTSPDRNQMMLASAEKRHGDMDGHRHIASLSDQSSSTANGMAETFALDATDDIREKEGRMAGDAASAPGIEQNGDNEKPDPWENDLDPTTSAQPGDEFNPSFLNHELSVVDKLLRPSILPVLPLPTIEDISPIEVNEEGIGDGIAVVPAAKKRNVVSLAMLASIGISTFDIKALNPASVEVAALLAQQVKSLEHISVEVNGGLPVNRTFSVETGVKLNQWTTQTTQQNSTHTPISREDVVRIRIDENGLAIPVHGLVQGLQVSTVQRIRYTQYSTMDLAVSLRAAIWRSRRWQGDVTGIAAFNVVDEVSGSTFNEEGDIWKFSSAENPFVRKSKWSAGIRLQLAYHVTPHLSVHSTMGYNPVRYILHQNQQHTEWTHSLLRGNIGIQYQL